MSTDGRRRTGVEMGSREKVKVSTDGRRRTGVEMGRREKVKVSTDGGADGRVSKKLKCRRTGVEKVKVSTDGPRRKGGGQKIFRLRIGRGIE